MVRVRLRAAGGVQSTPVSAHAADILRGLRGVRGNMRLFRMPKKRKIAPKWGFEPIIFRHRGSILSRCAWRVAPAAA
jgi:hypothetical protein